jgi:putative flippase GtrA
MIFVAVILTGALEYILPGFRLSVISCLLMITLLSQVDSTYALVPEYALSVMIGVVIGIICSFIFHAYKNTQNKA